MGCLFSARLKNAGYEVTLYNRENEKIKLIKKQGIQLTTSENEKITVPVSVEYNAKNLKPEYELILVLLKAFATETVLRDIQHIIDENTIVLTLQNGVGNLENIEKVVPHAILGVGGTGSGASVLGLGAIAHRATGKTNIGYLEEKHHSKFEAISEMLTKAGLETEVSENVQSVIWSKLMVNVAYNSLTAITRLKNGDTILTASGEEIVRSLVTEAADVARAEGIKLLYKDPVNEILQLGREKIAKNQSSMLTDVRQKRKTEIEVINGAIVSKARKHGIPVPYNEVMLQLVHLLEDSYPLRIE
jgi:2-dehydropantoate 2-reductase